MDLSVNKSAKDFLKAQFQNWYAEQVVTYIDKNSDKVEAAKIDLSLTQMKPLDAKWLVKLYVANEAGKAQHRIPQPCAAGNCGV